MTAVSSGFSIFDGDYFGHEPPLMSRCSLNDIINGDSHFHAVFKSDDDKTGCVMADGSIYCIGLSGNMYRYTISTGNVRKIASDVEYVSFANGLLLCSGGSKTFLCNTSGKRIGDTFPNHKNPLETFEWISLKYVRS